MMEKKNFKNSNMKLQDKFQNNVIQEILEKISGIQNMIEKNGYPGQRKC